MDYDGAPAGIVYHIIKPVSVSDSRNSTNKNIILYSIIALILLSGISILVLFL